MKLICNRLSFIIISGILVVVIFSFFDLANANLSPQFPLQKIDDPPKDWYYYPLMASSNCSTMPQPSQIPDMTGVSYFSDGESLNATIWLSGPFQQIPKPFARFPIYAMWVGIIQPNDIQTKVDYTNTIEWNPLDSTWSKSLSEISSNDTRIIAQTKNHTKFFDNAGGKGHVNLSVDLRRLTSPSEYFIVFALIDDVVYKGNMCGLLDITGTSFYVPPPVFRSSVYPAPIELRQGEEKTAELRLNSTSLVKPLVHFSLNDLPKDLVVSIKPNKTYATPAGITTSLIDVSASESARTGPYTIQINSTISYPVTIDVNSIVASEFSKVTQSSVNGTQSNVSPSTDIITDSISTKIIKSRPFYFTVLVTSFTFDDQFRSFWSAYGDFISLIAGGFVAGFTALVFDRIRRKRDKT